MAFLRGAYPPAGKSEDRNVTVSLTLIRINAKCDSMKRNEGVTIRLPIDIDRESGYGNLDVNSDIVE